MTSEVEFDGHSVEEAVQKACSALRLAETDLDYTVLDEGSGGLFGIGSRPVRIRASVPEGVELEMPKPEKKSRAHDDDDNGVPGIVGPAPEKAAQALEVTQTLVEKMGMRADVTVRDEETEIVVELNEVEESTEIADMLAGVRPPALPSLQFLLNKIVNRFPDSRKHIVLLAPSVAARAEERRNARAQNQERPAGPPRQVAELPEDVDPELAALAQKLAERAVSLGKVITIHPMAASDRRAVHQTIMTLEGVETVSEGDGLYRKMHIVPASLSGGAGRKKRRRRRRRRPGGAEGGAEASAE